jgi:hypothetical protein
MNQLILRLVWTGRVNVIRLLFNNLIDLLYCKGSKMLGCVETEAILNPKKHPIVEDNIN